MSTLQIPCRCHGCGRGMSVGWAFLFKRRWDAAEVSGYFCTYACFLNWCNGPLSASVGEHMGYCYPVDMFTNKPIASQKLVTGSGSVFKGLPQYPQDYE